jgi:hypothetical protein
VVRVVLQDLAAIPDELAPLSFSRGVPRQLRASLVSADSCPNDFSWLVDDVRAAVPRQMRSAVGEANKDADRRTGNANPAVTLGANQVAEIRSCPKTSVGSHGLSWNDVYVYLPGYAERGTVSVVKLYFPEILHPSLAVYVLKWQGKEWRVIGRKLVTLL